ncbi:helix-turn-helix domain-containing protein [Arthrobacter sp. 35W]|uniref:helix-turn-helix domain-containing protein n=1 Tax=Arthrobacter sp. 35W TaxID=1132441 RepID=UPI0003F71874|nr:helix-turn-helix transcriptional regulator [Arthrobacter sp. 35W]
MSVPAKAFQQWLHRCAPGLSSAEVCRIAGIKRSTLAQQMVRGKVSISTIVSIARALGLDVVGALAGFEKYQDLPDGAAQPTAAELISQVSDMDLLREILSRQGSTENPPPPAGSTFPRDWALAPLPHRTSVRCWIDAVGPVDLRQRIAKEAAIAPQNLSSQISANRLAPDLAIVAARIAGVGLTNGLVVTGTITSVEAGWMPGSRTAALQAMPSAALVTLAAGRLENLGRTLRRFDADNEQAAALWENLG